MHFVSGSVDAEPEQMPLPGGGIVEHRYAERGQLAVINAGALELGYRICQWCGAGEPARPGQWTASEHE